MKITKETINDHLIDYQLKMIGKTIDEAIKTKEWFSKWTMTQEEHEKFKKYALQLIKITLKSSKVRTEKIFSWFNLEFGLRIHKT